MQLKHIIRARLRTLAESTPQEHPTDDELRTLAAELTPDEARGLALSISFEQRLLALVEERSQN